MRSHPPPPQMGWTMTIPVTWLLKTQTSADCAANELPYEILDTSAKKGSMYQAIWAAKAPPPRPCPW